MTKTRLTALTLVFAAFVAPPVSMSAGVEKNKSSAPPYVPGEIIVKFKSASASGLTATQMKATVGQLRGPSTRLQALHQKHGLREVKRIFAARPKNRVVSASLKARLDRRQRRASAAEKRNGDTLEAGFERTFKLTFATDASVERIVAEYKKDPDVEYAEPNYIMKAFDLPNDPYLYSVGSWGQPYDDLWGLKKIEAPAAWEITKGAGVVVAVVDSGIDLNHPDINDNLWTNAGEIPNDFQDNDGNGFVDDVYGWNFANENNNPYDDVGHGTHVAGTIAAEGNNGLGIVGVAWQSKVMAVKGLGTMGGYSYMLAGALRYAVDNGADVINNSWGGMFFSQTVADAVAYAHGRGAVLVASAGNDYANVVSFVYPAALPEVITVSASDTNDQKADFSNFGPEIEVAAPGGNSQSDPWPDNILSLKAPLARTYPTVGSNLTRLRGTSMAAPHVSGVAALILARHPSYSNEDVRRLLLMSVDDVDAPGFDNNTGYGRINAYRAVRDADFAGHLDVATNDGFVGGWTVDRARPVGSIDVHIYLYDQATGAMAGGYVVRADQDRPDINQAIGVTGRHGYSWTVPSQFHNGRTYDIYAYGVNVDMYAPLNGSPKSFTIPNAGPIGFLDGIAGGTAGGWGLDPDTPSQSISVHMYAQDAQGQWSFLGAVVANQPRPDINQATGHPGDHGFTFSIPGGYQGQTLWAWAIDAQGGPAQALTGSAMPIP
jgi:subtilisin family serine protease